MQNISSLLCRFFSKTLHSPSDSMGFAIIQKNEHVPDDLKDAIVLLLIVRQSQDRLTHQVGGFYSNGGDKIYSKTFAVNSNKLPNVKDTEFIHHPLRPDESWTFVERPDTKTYFSKSSALWVQNTILIGHMSYIVFEKRQKRDELEFLTGFLSRWQQESTTYKRKNICHSIIKWIQERNDSLETNL